MGLGLGLLVYCPCSVIPSFVSHPSMLFCVVLKAGRKTGFHDRAYNAKDRFRTEESGSEKRRCLGGVIVKSIC